MCFVAEGAGIILRLAAGIEREVEDVMRWHVRHENIHTMWNLRPHSLELHSSAAEALQ